MTDSNVITADSPSVQAHLAILQSVVQRMASNSSSSKAWCIALVSAVLVIVVDKSKPDYVWIAAIPTLLFLCLDAYYLALEKAFIVSYNGFIEKLHHGSISASDLYVVEPAGSLGLQFLAALRSFSVWPVYATLFGMIYVVDWLLG